MAITIFMAWSLFPSAVALALAEPGESCRSGRHGRRHRLRRNNQGLCQVAAGARRRLPIKGFACDFWRGSTAKEPGG
jgi:hypothetical protein